MTSHHRPPQTGSFATTGAVPATGQAQGLSRLLAEMRALGALMPGVAGLADSDDPDESHFDRVLA